MEKMTCIAFSKDRAMQVDATLRSFFAHCMDSENVQLSVLYACSNEQHSRQYEQLIREWGSHLKVKFVLQNHFRRDVLNILNPYPEASYPDFIYKALMCLLPRLVRMLMRVYDLPHSTPLVLFLVDDAIFTREFALSEIALLLSEHKDTLGFSLRLGKNITYCYMNDRPQPLPVFQPIARFIQKHNWTKAELDFAYPLEVSSSIYRLDDILPVLLGRKFNTPNSMEGGMNVSKNLFALTLPFLMSYDYSVSFCNPVNVVQTISPENRSGAKRHYSVKELSNLFDAGKRINIDTYHHIIPISCHQEMDLVFE
jgi:hypothetical protein